MAALCLAGSTLTRAQAPSAPPAQAPAPAPQPRADQRLPVRRVVLYKSGVGYFEHLGRVRGNQTVTVDFTSGQLNDVLKSLTTLDLNGGRVTNVNFNSSAALERQLAALRLPLGETTTRGQLLGALRGARVDVGGESVRASGRLLSVEQVERRRDGNVATMVDAVTLVTDAGDVRQIVLDPGVNVRIADAALNREVGEYLSLIASARDQDVRQLTLSTTGTGERDLFVSYISEVPVWKATYRLVFPSTGDARTPLLQGWAIVDNTVGADWDNVELSLVAGAPQSFVQDISRPYYTQRPVVPVQTQLQMTPQTFQAGMPQASPAAAADGIVAGGGGGGRGGGANRAAMETVGAPPPAPPMPPPMSERVDAARAALQSEAVAAQMGDLFEYKLKERVTLKKNQSALVPILAGDVTADKVSVWNASNGTRPVRAIWLTNTTGLTLDGGTFSIVEGNAFAGEGLLDPVKPGERRLLSYALDLAMQVTATGDSTPTPVTKVSVTRGVLVQATEARQSRTYTASNQDTEARTLVIEHPARSGWTLGGAVKPEESTVSWHRFRLAVPAKSTAKLQIDEAQPVVTQVSINNIDDNRIGLLVRDKVLSPQLEAALREVVARKTAIARVTADVTAKQREVEQIGRDQERVRGNMQVLKGTAEERELLQRYVRQLNDQENRLDVLRKELQTSTVERQKLESDLAAFIQGISG